ncbi:glycosyltransferase family 4 protein [Phenylobacterium sp.]|uniref:glycosyltransferase family 4 protein n=1 Tax=Phenylobacterium sp. TaxID=1871053 RepID=UPI0025D5D296|nr:glycosyltransferase family 4 protein [Phenylobacterium sp.]MBX3482746.1 glycosyltransferase family 4 protein [Phenylobacterium sp.]MCW5758531.1 glycosyltransferase family 4 protein [Phenylobacterium sp.]
MSNAAIYLHPNAFDTSGEALLGRHSAGESFLRGFVRHADVDRFHFWNAAGRPQAELDALVQRIEAPGRPINWIGQTARGRLAEAGALNYPSPGIDAEAWRRRAIGQQLYALTGITHTTATGRTMRIIGDLLTAPLRDYDALICTSSAVRGAVETQLQMVREHLAELHGPRRSPELQRVTIPLGVNCGDFQTSPADRKRWREQLGIPDDAIVVLYVGRFQVKVKMNPALMAMALERAARRTSKEIWWVNSGWIEPAGTEAVYHGETAKLCPSVRYVHVDGRPADVRFSIWSVADLFISFSDNIQETFGLTPVEAMAAGLPCVVSDWNGYRDTVRDGLDGVRIPTTAPRPNFGGDLAYYFENAWITYDNYVGATAQYVAVDLQKAEEALLRLFEDADLRRTLGAQAQRQAREVFDWAAIIPQYQALWAEQDARRRAHPPAPPRVNPYRPDPYTLFAGYPTRHLQPGDVLAINPGMDWPAAKARLDAPMAAYSRFNRPTPAECETVIAFLAEHGAAPVARLRELIPEGRRNFLERGLLWLARHDVVTIHPAA